MDFDLFLSVHEQQLSTSTVPLKYRKALFEKLQNETYDAGDNFQMHMVVDDEGALQEWRIIVISEDGISVNDPQHIYLLDHAWTFNCSIARPNLQEIPGLLDRMMALMDIEERGRSKEELIELVLHDMWKFNQTYSFGHYSFGSDESMPIWYILDEFGSRIQLSDEPNFRIVPFVFAETGLSYSIMWPLKDLEKGDTVTRGFLPTPDPDIYQAQKIPWVQQNMKHISYKQEEPDDSYFNSYKHVDILPSSDIEYPSIPQDRNLCVFTENTLLKNNLTDPRFEFVEDEWEADILWQTKHFRDFNSLSEKNPGSLINQFPYEDIVTLKDIMAVVARRCASSDHINPMEANPKWLPITYNLRTEFTKFISYFQHREEHGLNNLWILKPWNLARALDTHVTSNLSQIIRLNESGPKVVCKYIENPVLFDRDDVGMVKFDIRYVVLLSSVEPLEMYAYQVFWLRFANKAYSLDHFDDYEKHFTVMNYADEGKNLKQIHYDDFIPMFEAQNPDFLWSDIENDIFIMIKELFQAAISAPPPRGIAHNPQSRALYGVDLMLEWNTKPSGEKYMQPKICEVNFQPDCTRACLYHPFFYNDVFSVLFLNDTDDKHVVPL